VVFTSLAFAVFLPVVLGVYYLLARRWQNLLLLAASYVFYSQWDWRFAGLLALTTTIDFAAGLGMAGAGDRRHRRRYLLLSIVSNLTVLGFFKYYGFFVDSAVGLLSAFGFHASVPTLRIVLPVGISFYTFQSMAYVIDIYRGRVEARRDFLTFALFVSFFPQLVSGPIERAAHLLPQLEHDRRATWLHIQQGMALILLGWFKKVGVADAVGVLVDARFQHPETASGSDLLLALVLFSVQIYCDFGGYSDMARGVARLFGIDLMANFARPYFARSITEFWRRWHISLSSWLRDYLFLPVSFALSRKMDGIAWLGLKDDVWVYGAGTLITMLLGGLWHGASWTFVAWGGLHGLCLFGHRIWLTTRRRARKRAWRMPAVLGAWLAHGLTLVFVLLTWVFFRADSFPGAWAYLSGIASWQAASGMPPIGWVSARIWTLVGGLALLDLAAERSGDEFVVWRLNWRLRGVVYGAIVVVTLVLGNPRGDVPFIYFQF
jgi:alginate O-acetyltransferase complex protein AlgI